MDDPAAFLEARVRLAGKLADAAGLEVELVILNEAPIALAGRVVRDGRPIYSRDEPARVRYESRTFREFVDFDYHAAQIERARLRRTARGER